MKTVVIALALVLIASTAFAWTDICQQRPNETYCRDVGKTAYNLSGGPRGMKMGKIIGVAWRVTGSIVSKSGMTAKRDGYYYIVNDGLGAPFIRACAEIEAR